MITFGKCRPLASSQNNEFERNRKMNKPNN